MAAEWYKLFNLADFLATGLVSRTLIFDLEGRGPTTFEVFRGNEVSVAYDDAFLPVSFLDQNPYAQPGYAVYLDSSDDVWFGFEVPE